MIIDFGCGQFKTDGSVGVDINNQFNNVDVVCDLNCFPYPFVDCAADKIVLHNVLEHLRSPWKTLKECYRILKPGGVLSVRLPHYSGKSFYADPTHINKEMGSCDLPRYLLGRGYMSLREYPECFWFSSSGSLRFDWCGSCVRSVYPLVGVVGALFDLVGNVNIVFTERVLSKFIGFEEFTFEVVK